jgi:ubiquinone/menaquinone biosynthesis C-methylase UbiE
MGNPTDLIKRSGDLVILKIIAMNSIQSWPTKALGASAAIAILCAAVAAAQSTDVTALVQKEFPDNERLHELRVPDIFQALDLKNDSAVADVGAGPGDFSVLLALVATKGRVIAEDIDEKSMQRLRERVQKKGLGNVEVILGQPDDPKLPIASLDGVLIVESYHEMPQYESMLQHIRAALKPDGRLVIVDIMPMRTRNRPRSSQVKNHRIAPELVAGELLNAGFEIIERQDGFVDLPDSESAQWIIVSRRPLQTKR